MSSTGRRQDDQTQPKMAIRTLSLSLRNHTQILRDISLDIPTGKITSLIGPSGSGKSTLLRCLNRLHEPAPKTIFLEEQDITTLNVLALRQRVGMLLQTAALFEGSVNDNITYGPRLRKQRLSKIQVNELLEMVSLPPDITERSIDTLSGGQAQRVSLARTLANKPEVLLLDEPTSALDPAATYHIEEAIMNLRDRLGLTVVWVSHAIEQVQRTADFMALMVDGQILETGTPAHLLAGQHHHLTEDFAKGKLSSAGEENHHA